MHKINLASLALAVATASQLASANQQQSSGFIEGSNLTLDSRLLHFDRDFKQGQKKDRHASGLGLKLIFESGYTSGPAGFGVDAFAMQGFKLDASREHELYMFPNKNSGKPKSEYGQAGIAVKGQFSASSLKIGDQFVALPVFSTDDSRLLPESATGALLTSNELNGLEVHLGHFTALSNQASTARNSGDLDKISLGGLSYQLTEKLGAAYYFAKTSNLYQVAGDDAKKHYINLNYTHYFADDHSLNADFNAYRTIYTSATGGRDTNNARSLQLTYNLGAHSFILARQCVEGDGAYNYGYDGNATAYLANDSQIHGFHQAGEVSYKVGYAIDMGSFGVPGLSLSAAYIRGSKIDNPDSNQQGKNWERDLEARYVVQQGPAKDLSLRLRHASYRANDAAVGNSAFPEPPGKAIDEVRLIVEYPLSLL